MNTKRSHRNVITINKARSLRAIIIVLALTLVFIFGAVCSYASDSGLDGANTSGLNTVLKSIPS